MTTQYSIKDVFADLLSASVLFLISITYLLSYTALVFSGPLTDARADGLTIMLLTCLVTGVITGYFSSFRFACGSLDNCTIAFVATITGSIALDIERSASNEGMVSTVILTMLFSSCISGLSLIILGMFNAGSIVRLMPLPVVAGFLGTTGWILLKGGMRVGVGHEISFHNLMDFNIQLKLFIIFLISGVLYLTTNRFKSAIAVPVVLILLIIIHFTITYMIGFDVTEQTSSAWLINFPHQLPLPRIWTGGLFSNADWIEILHQLPNITIFGLIAPISLLLTTTGIEADTHEEANINHELVVGGSASILSGLLGGTIGFITFSRSMTLREAGARSRVAPLISSFLIGFIPLYFPSVLGFVPVTILGGLLSFLGIGLLKKWVFQVQNSMSFIEWISIPAVIIIAMNYGLISGILSGILFGCLLFTLSNILKSPVQSAYFGDVAFSNVERPHSAREILDQTANERIILHLQGYLFFGTANKLLSEIRAFITNTKDLKCIILNFNNVYGFDSTALSIIKKINTIVDGHEIKIIYTSKPGNISDQLKSTLHSPNENVVILETINDSLEYAENQSLKTHGPLKDNSASISSLLKEKFGEIDCATILSYFSKLKILAGASIIDQGTISNDLVFLESGCAIVYMNLLDDNPVKIKKLVAGTMIGELGFYVNTPRTASVVAEDDCIILKISPIDLKRIEKDKPSLALELHKLIAKRLCLRINDKDHLINGLIRNLGHI